MENKQIIDALIASGFTPCKLPSTGASSLIKLLKACEMPYVNEHIVGTLGVTDNDTFYVEVDIVEGTVAMGCEAARYYEDAVPLGSDEGEGILRDAGVIVPVVKKSDTHRPV